MKSVDFIEANLALAKDQPEYQTLYVYLNSGNEQGPMTMCFQLDKEEIDAIVRTGKLFITQITFNNGFQPINMSTLSPFPEPPEGTLPPADENRVAADLWDATHYSGTEGIIYPGVGYVIIGPCKNCQKGKEEHYWSTRQCHL